jgi:hypothetical protein
MKRLSAFSILMVCLIPTVLFSQEAPVEFKEIDKENLKMEYYSKDSSANALILCDFGNSKIFYDQMDERFQLKFERHIRIKVFNEKGVDQGNFEIPLFKSDGITEDISYLKGFTYNLKGNKIDRTRLRNRNVYTDEKNENWDVTKFAMPNVKPGSIIELKYSVESRFFFNLWEWQFQHTIPVKWSEYNINIPEYFQYNKHTYGYEPFTINEKSISNEPIVINYKTRRGKYVQETEYHSRTIDCRRNIHRWVMKDVPAFKNEKYTSCAKNYMNRIEFELARIQMPRSSVRNFAQTWQSINDMLINDEEFGKQLKKTNFIEEKVNDICSKYNDQKSKMQSIFNYVKNNIKWNNDYGIYTQKKLKKTYKEKTGNVAEINLLLTAMLREAEIYANPVILSTRKHGIIHPSHPSVSQTNYVIAFARIEGEDYLMDATNPYSHINLIPVRCLNGRAQIINEEQTKPLNIKLNIPYQKSNYVMLNFSNDNKLYATIKSINKKYAAYKFRNNINDYENRNEYIKEIEKGNNLVINDYKIKDLDSLHKPVTQVFDSVKLSNSSFMGDMVYINPIVYDRIDENPFKTENRKHPVDYAHPYSKTNTYQISIPENYTIESMPKSQVFKLPDNNAKFSYLIQQMGNRIIIRTKFKINKSIFKSDEYKNLRNFYNQLIKKQSEQIVLKKS